MGNFRFLIFSTLMFLLAAVGVYPVRSADLCHRGYLLYTPRYGPDICLECFSNQFMPHDKHSHRQCYECTEIRDPKLEILVSACNNTHDTEIHCIDGYYRTVPSYPDVRAQCQKCSDCPFPKRQCQKFSDTICCPADNYGFYINKAGEAICVRQCGPGEFFDSATDKCVICPQDTYMDENRHINMHCKNCVVPTSENEMVLRLCSSTHPTVIGCKDGLYRRQDDHSSTGICVPCRRCAENTDSHFYEGRACEQLHDTVCCPNPGMLVEDTPDGPECVSLTTPFIGETSTSTLEPSPVCGEGEYLSSNDRIHLAICLPCPQGTYMNETGHRRALCKSCKEFPHVEYCPPDTIDYKIRQNNNVTLGEALALMVAAIVTTVVLVVMIQFVILLKCDKYSEWMRMLLGTTRHHTEESIPLMDSTANGNLRVRKRKISSDTTTAEWDIQYPVGFIPVTEFSAANLPAGYSDDVMVDLIKLQSDLTVFVSVECTSEHRPEIFPGILKSYPYSNQKYRTEPHTGSGWVERVKIYESHRCRCRTCQQSQQPEMSWGEIIICTATRLVFDILEGKQSHCFFFYDSPDTDLHNCPSVSDAVKVLSDIQRDCCYMTFVTHNIDLVKLLQEKLEKYRELRRRIQDKYGVVREDEGDGFTEKIRKLYRRFEDSLKLLVENRRKMKSRSRERISLKRTDFLHKFGFTFASYSSDIPVPAAHIPSSGDEGELLKMLSDVQKIYDSRLGDIKVLMGNSHNVVPESEDEQLLLDKCRQMSGEADVIDKCLHLLQALLAEIDKSLPSKKYPAYRPAYNPSHPLTVLVSHPEGKSKQISLGRVVNRESVWFDYQSIYRYTNETCQGCEGARVFVLGNTELSDHGHSGKVDDISESGAWSNILNLTVIHVRSITTKEKVD